MTRRAFTIGQVGNSVVLALVAFWTISTLILEDSFVVRGKGSRWTFINVGLVDELAAHDRAPVTLWTRIIVVRAPLANVARLAAATVRDLTLRCLNTHGLKGASNWI
jgi:hypothetical protein